VTHKRPGTKGSLADGRRAGGAEFHSNAFQLDMGQIILYMLFLFYVLNLIFLIVLDLNELYGNLPF
jgi:hypothetical protein